MTTYIAAYDTENERCLKALPRIVGVHREYQMPATFFVVTKLLDIDGDLLRDLIGSDPLFEIGSHSCTHMLLREHRLCGKPGPSEQHPHEVIDSKAILEEFFGREVTGFRPPVCFCDALKGGPEILELCRKAGYAYTSSLGWGPYDSLPVVPQESFTYAEQGYPEIVEIPPCGWHENLLKGNNKWDPRPLQLFPHPMPEAAITGHVDNPAEEFEVHRKFIDKAVREDIGHVSLIWHPWSLNAFDPEMEMLSRTFKYVRELNLPVATFGGYADTLKGE